MADITPDFPYLSDIWTPNFDRTKGFDAGSPHIFVVHSTRSGVGTYTLDQEFSAVTNFIDHVNERQVGIHWLVGGTKTRRMCHDDRVAWHAKWHSYQGHGVEVCQPKDGMPFSDYQYKTVAQLAARYCHQYGIPTERIVMNSSTRGSTEERKKGIIGHEDTVQGHIDGKSDPGHMWDWNKFIPMVKAEYARLFVPKPPVPPVVDPSKLDPFSFVGSGIASYLKAHADLGIPRTVKDDGTRLEGLCHWDTLGNEIVWTTTNHLIVYRKANNKIYAYDMPW